MREREREREEREREREGGDSERGVGEREEWERRERERERERRERERRRQWERGGGETGNGERERERERERREIEWERERERERESERERGREREIEKERERGRGERERYAQNLESKGGNKFYHFGECGALVIITITIFTICSTFSFWGRKGLWWKKSCHTLMVQFLRDWHEKVVKAKKKKKSWLSFFWGHSQYLRCYFISVVKCDKPGKKCLRQYSNIAFVSTWLHEAEFCWWQFLK